MASGLAIVAHDYAAAGQHLRHGLSALLARRDSHEDFIGHAVCLARDFALVRRLGAEARQTSLALGWERIVRDFERVLQQCASRENSAREARHAAA